MLPTVAGFPDLFTFVSPKKRTGLACGSFGWGGQSIDQVEEGLKSCGFEMLEQVRTKYIPEQQMLDAVTTKIESLL